VIKWSGRFSRREPCVEPQAEPYERPCEAARLLLESLGEGRGTGKRREN